MPLVHIYLTDDGVTPDQKAQLVEGVTRLLQDLLDKNPATTHVLISEVPTDNWGIGGELVTVRRARQQGQS